MPVMHVSRRLFLSVFLFFFLGWINPGVTAPPAEQKQKDLRYEDLGPNTIDVSNYSDFQKVNYRLFLQRCSRCHTPARAINSPIVSETKWKKYVHLMHVRSKRIWLNPDDPGWIVSFLAYDSQIRKVDHRDQFMKQQKELQERFAKH